MVLFLQLDGEGRGGETRLVCRYVSIACRLYPIAYRLSFEGSRYPRRPRWCRAVGRLRLCPLPVAATERRGEDRRGEERSRRPVDAQ